MTVRALTAEQQHVVDRLLDLNAERPVPRVGLAEDLRSMLSEGTADAVEVAGGDVFVSKGTLATLEQCEGQSLAREQSTRGEVSMPLMVGDFIHRSIAAATKIAGLTSVEYVAAATRDAIASRPEFKDRWLELDPVQQATAITRAEAAVESWQRAWPVIPNEWNPRTEVAMRVTIGGLVLYARPDVVVGTPRPQRQTVLIVENKTGVLRGGPEGQPGEHHAEAGLHALIATLIWEVPPFRSTVYSLATGAWTLPCDVDEAMLVAAAERVVQLVQRWVAIRHDGEAATLTPGPWCSWCPAVACPAFSEDPPDTTDAVGPLTGDTAKEDAS